MYKYSENERIDQWDDDFIFSEPMTPTAQQTLNNATSIKSATREIEKNTQASPSKLFIDLPVSNNNSIPLPLTLTNPQSFKTSKTKTQNADNDNTQKIVVSDESSQNYHRTITDPLYRRQRSLFEDCNRISINSTGGYLSNVNFNNDFIDVDETLGEEEVTDDADINWALEFDRVDDNDNPPTALSYAAMLRDAEACNGGVITGADGDIASNSIPKESLLEYLESNAHSTLFESISNTPIAALKNNEKSLLGVDASVTQSSNQSSTSSGRDYFDNEERNFVEAANPHLKGLLDWIYVTTTSLQSVINNSNSNDIINARTLMSLETVLPDDDINYIDKLLEQLYNSSLSETVEELATNVNFPTSAEACKSLQTVAKWLRGLCNLHDNIIGTIQAQSAITDKTSSFLQNKAAENNKKEEYGHYQSEIPVKINVPASLNFSSLAISTSAMPNLPPATQTSMNITENVSETSYVVDDNGIYNGISGRYIDSVFTLCESTLKKQIKLSTFYLNTCYCSLVLAIKQYRKDQNTADRHEHRKKWQNQAKYENVSYEDDYELEDDNESDYGEDDQICFDDTANFRNFGKAGVENKFSCRKEVLDGNLISNMIRLISEYLCLCRVQLSIMEIKMHLYNKFDLPEFLCSLRDVVDYLANLNDNYIKTLNSVLSNTPRNRENKANIDNCVVSHFSCYNELDIMFGTNIGDVTHQSTTEKENNRRLSITDQYINILSTIALDLRGACISAKLLAVCYISPITYQKLPNNVTNSAVTEITTTPLESTQHFVSQTRTEPDVCYHPSVSINTNVKDNSVAKYDLSGRRPSGPFIVQNCNNSNVNSVNTYNVSYELGLGKKFIEMILSIPSPSVIRSKLSFSAFLYLQKLKHRELPWQQKNFKCKLVSVRHPKQQLQHTYQQQVNHLGIGYMDMDTNSLDFTSLSLTVSQVENGIMQSFSEAFGSLDQLRIMQLLLYEGAVELLPTISRKVPNENSNHLNTASIRTNSQTPQSPGYAKQSFREQRGSSNGVNNSNNSTAYGGGNCVDTTSSVCFPSFTEMKDAFSHASFVIDFSQTLKEKCDIATTNIKTELTSAQQGDDKCKCCTNSLSNFTNVDNTLPPMPPVIQNSIQNSDKRHNRRLSKTLRYEMFNLSNEIILKLAEWMVDRSPNTALDLYELCITILGHLHNDKKITVEKEAVMLAIKLDRRGAAILHGESVLAYLQQKGGNINEMLYMTDLIAAQYSENAQYELAVKALLSAISVLNNRHKLSRSTYITTSTPTNSRKDGTICNGTVQICSTTEFERAVDPLLQKLGHTFLQFCCFDRAADAFQVLLASLEERTDCVANDAKKVIVLSWLAEAYMEMQDYDTCEKVIASIKQVRADKIHKVTYHATELKFNVSQRQRPTIQPDFEDRLSSSDKPSHSIMLQYLRNSTESNLPHFCVTSEDIDLGYITARLHFECKRYVTALKCLTPTLIGVEALVGGRGRSRRALIELAQLYFLRGEIQLTASQSSATVKYPFHVGSSQLFTAVCALSVEHNKSIIKSTSAINTYTNKMGMGSHFSTKDLNGGSRFHSHRLRNRQERQYLRWQFGLEHLGGCLHGKTHNLQESNIALSNKDNSASKNNTTNPTSPQYSCTRAITYNNPADLCWDAMKWFRRSWDAFKAAGDEIGSAEAAGAIARCHLVPAFVPHALFNVPLDKALNLSTISVEHNDELLQKNNINEKSLISQNLNDLKASNYTPELNKSILRTKLNRSCSSSSNNIECSVAFIEKHDIKSRNKSDSEPNKSKLTSFNAENMRTKPNSTSIITRSASLKEVQRIMLCALDINLECCLPLPLMESYINLAELNVLQGNRVDAIAFWWETKELFQHLLVDGSLIPLVRRASIQFIKKTKAVLDRLVRFLWATDRVIMNQHLYLLDVQVVLSHELDRANRNCRVRARNVAKLLPEVLDRLVQRQIRDYTTTATGALAADAEINEENSSRHLRKASAVDRIGKRITRALSFAYNLGDLSPSSWRLNKSNKKNGLTSTMSVESSNNLNEAFLLNSNKKEGVFIKNLRVSVKNNDLTCAENKIGNNYDKTVDKDLPFVPTRHNSFDQFINRNHFSLQQDVRRFYNTVNSDLVMEKVHNYSWSQYVEYDYLLKHISSNVINSGSSCSNYPVYNNSDHSSAPASVHIEKLGQTNILAQLDGHEKENYHLKYQQLSKHILANVLQRRHLLKERVENEDIISAQENEKEYTNMTSTVASTNTGIESNTQNSFNNIFAYTTNYASENRQSIGKDGNLHFDCTSKKELLNSGPPLDSAYITEPENAHYRCIDAPLDPYADFEWMDESFADYSPHNQSLQASALHKAKRSTNTHTNININRSEGPAQYTSLFMPELDESHYSPSISIENAEIHESNNLNNIGSSQSPSPTSIADHNIVSGSTGASSITMPKISKEFMLKMDDKAETILIQRVWRCYLLLKNARDGYKMKKRSLNALRFEVRNALCSWSIYMHRLRAFSRQYQHSMVEYENLLEQTSTLTNSQAFEQNSKNKYPISGEANARCIGGQNNNLNCASILRFRLPFSVHVIHVQDLLLLYHPHTGTKHIQQFGGAGYLLFSAFSKPDLERQEQQIQAALEKDQKERDQREFDYKDMLLQQQLFNTPEFGMITKDSLSMLSLHSSSNVTHTITTQTVKEQTVDCIGSPDLMSGTQTLSRPTLLISNISRSLSGGKWRQKPLSAWGIFPNNECDSSNESNELNEETNRRRQFYRKQIRLHGENSTPTLFAEDAYPKQLSSAISGQKSKEKTAGDTIIEPVRTISEFIDIDAIYFSSDCNLKIDESLMIYDLAASNSDICCGGGKKSRQKILKQIRVGVLAPALLFLEQTKTLVDYSKFSIVDLFNEKNININQNAEPANTVSLSATNDVATETKAVFDSLMSFSDKRCKKRDEHTESSLSSSNSLFMARHSPISQSVDSSLNVFITPDDQNDTISNSTCSRFSSSESSSNAFSTYSINSGDDILARATGRQTETEQVVRQISYGNESIAANNCVGGRSYHSGLIHHSSKGEMSISSNASTAIASSEMVPTVFTQTSIVKENILEETARTESTSPTHKLTEDPHRSASLTGTLSYISLTSLFNLFNTNGGNNIGHGDTTEISKAQTIFDTTPNKNNRLSNERNLLNDNIWPTMPIPITLICSHTLNAIPWEILLLDDPETEKDCLHKEPVTATKNPESPEELPQHNLHTVVRSISLYSLCNQIFSRSFENDDENHDDEKGSSQHKILQMPKTYLGPSLKQRAQFVVVAQADSKGLTDGMTDELCSLHQTRRITTGLQCVTDILHNVDHILSSNNITMKNIYKSFFDIENSMDERSNGSSGSRAISRSNGSNSTGTSRSRQSESIVSPSVQRRFRFLYQIYCNSSIPTSSPLVPLQHQQKLNADSMGKLDLTVIGVRGLFAPKQISMYDFWKPLLIDTQQHPHRNNTLTHAHVSTTSTSISNATGLNNTAIWKRSSAHLLSTAASAAVAAATNITNLSNSLRERLKSDATTGNATLTGSSSTACLPTSTTTTGAGLSNNVNCFTSTFPILLMSYVDYIEVSDALAFLVSHRHDAIFLFAPYFVIEYLATELKATLDRWYSTGIEPPLHSFSEELHNNNNNNSISNNRSSLNIDTKIKSKSIDDKNESSPSYRSVADSSFAISLKNGGGGGGGDSSKNDDVYNSTLATSSQTGSNDKLSTVKKIILSIENQVNSASKVSNTFVRSSENHNKNVDVCKDNAVTPEKVVKNNNNNNSITEGNNKGFEAENLDVNTVEIILNDKVKDVIITTDTITSVHSTPTDNKEHDHNHTIHEEAFSTTTSQQKLAHSNSNNNIHPSNANNTCIYHVIMSVVNRVQREHAVPIIVFA